jgi:O-antigen/teichoic acid export membrane protein
MIRTLYKKIRDESIYANSAYLLSSWVLLSGLGFVFWTICTNIYSDEQVGTAGALLAALNLITSLSLMGFEIAIIRIMPRYRDKSKLLNVCFSTAAVFGVAFSVVFIALQGHIAADLGVVRSNILVALLFIAFVIIYIGSHMIESTFIAYRKSAYVTTKNLIFSVLKLGFPFLLIPLGAFGILSAWMFSLGIAVLYSLLVLWRRFGHRIRPQFSLSTVKGLVSYSLANYVASFAEGLPIMVLPLLVIYLFGPSQNAYYYIAMMLATSLFTVSISATQSLFAEGSHYEDDLMNKIVKSLRFMAVLLVPGVAVAVVFGPYILSIFGESYSTEATGLLRILALSSLPVALNSIARTIFRLHYRIAPLIVVSLASSLLIVFLAWALRDLDLDGVGYAWLAGQMLSLVAFGFLLVRDRRILFSLKDI